MKNAKSILLLVIASFLVLSFYPNNNSVAHAKAIELNFATVMPPPAALTQLMAKWAEDITKKSAGKVKINFYPGASLLKHEEMYRGVKQGIADIVHYGVGEDPGVLDLNSFTKLPFIGYKSWKQATIIYNEMLRSGKFPELMAEFEDEGLIPYFCRMPPAFQFFNTKKPVRNPKDLKGMKCYTIGDLADTVNKAGGAPVMLEITEVNMSLERGLIQGVFTHFAAMKVFGLLEKQKYATIFDEGGCYTPLNCFLINAKSWNRLPSDVQKLFKDSEVTLLADADKMDDEEIKEAKEISHKFGITFLELSPREIKVWKDLAKPTVDKWMANMEKKGKGKAAKAIWAEVQKQINIKKK